MAERRLARVVEPSAELSNSISNERPPTVSAHLSTTKSPVRLAG